MENLDRDLFKERDGKRRKEQEQKSEQQVSEDRWGDRKWRTYIGISKRERGREKKGKSTDLSNRSLKTNRETESGEPT